MAIARFDNDAARLLFVQGDLEGALVLIHRTLRRPVCAFLRRYYPGLSAEDIADSWGNTLSSVLKAMRSGSFSIEKPWFPWICQIAFCRACDCRRRMTTQESSRIAAAEILNRSQAHQPWIDPSERSELQQVIRQAIQELPHKQRVVFQAFIDHFPETESMDLLQEEVSRVTGQPETMASVKRALQEARRKVRAYLSERSYAPAGERDDS
ncbi:hypothetical protein AYO40_00550 [Planctomycetaceae bacterium SCGC AG-212-D15]|nr:hypothetical protein AYO40_00550 [Planctomycetaceae bacterium SCGC AG-212-D15]